MTQLQIMRALLQRGCTITLSRREDGYHIAVEGESKAGPLYTWEAMDPRLDQAITQIAAQVGLLEGAKGGNIARVTPEKLHLRDPVTVFRDSPKTNPNSEQLQVERADLARGEFNGPCEVVAADGTRQGVFSTLQVHLKFSTWEIVTWEPGDPLPPAGQAENMTTPVLAKPATRSAPADSSAADFTGPEPELPAYLSDPVTMFRSSPKGSPTSDQLQVERADILAGNFDGNAEIVTSDGRRLGAGSTLQEHLKFNYWPIVVWDLGDPLPPPGKAE